MNLLVHQGALGDWVLTFPLLRAMPGETLAASSGAKARLAAKLIHGVTALDADDRDFTLLHRGDGAAAVSAVFRDRLAAVDGLIVGFVSGAGGPWEANMRRLAPRARMACVDPRPPEGWTRHVGDWHRSQLLEHGVVLPEPPPERTVEKRSNPSGPIVIHPGSGGQAKCWPRERYEILIASLRDDGLPVLPLLGEVECETWPLADRRRWCEPIGAREVTGLDELRAVLAGARLYVGNDSGPTHLAAQIGLPTIALFGPSSPQVWSPVGPSVRVLAPPAPAAMAWLSADVVIRAVGS